MHSRARMLLYADEIEESDVEEAVPDYPVHLFFTQEGYFKGRLRLSLCV